MECSFFNLIAPWTANDLREWLESRTLKFQRGRGENPLAGITDWALTRALIEANAMSPADFRITSRKRLVQPIFFRGHAGVDRAKFASLLEKGASVVLNPLHPYIPALQSLNNDVQRFAPSERVKVTGTLTTGEGGAFPPHYDPEDILTIQLEGTKRWRIYGHQTENPVWGTPKRGKFEGEPIFDEVLQPGDLLLMPAGYWHICDNGAGHSYHLGIMFQPPTGWDAVRGLLPQLLEIDAFRRPLSRFSNQAARAAHDAELKAKLIELIGDAALEKLAAASWPSKPSSTNYEA